jgi:hypothetical protein
MPLYSTACPLPLNRKISRHRVSTSPIPTTGLSLWLKADAGVTTSTITPTYISQIIISGAGETTSDGTYTRASGGNISFTCSNGNSIYGSGGNWYLSDSTFGDDTYANYNFLNASSWEENAGSSPAPSAVNTSSNETPYYEVTAWADQSGNGNNATSIVNPVYTASAKNGKPAITFSGTELMTTANIFNGANPRTMFAVYYIDNDSTANTICGQTNDIEVINGSFFLLQGRSDYTNPYLATANDDLSGTNFTNQVWKIATADYNGTTANLYDNGGNVGTDVFYWNTHNGTFCIGAYFTNDNIGSLQELLVGKIAEIVVYDRVLTTPERQQVEAYLNTKYAIY